jgi:hypothetical protein
MRGAVPQLPSDEVANIGRAQFSHGDAAASELLSQQQPDDSEMIATRIESHEGLTHYGLYDTVVAKD